MRRALPRRAPLDLAHPLDGDADTGFHDHDLSAGAAHVVRGRVREERLLGGEPEVRESGLARRSRSPGPGETFTLAAADIHRVIRVGDEPALTVHAYLPPLTRMGSYVLEETGALTRYAICHEQELRQLRAA